jgi:Zn-dependent peptidase ImmA (M78 family)
MARALRILFLPFTRIAGDSAAVVTGTASSAIRLSSMTAKPIDPTQDAKRVLAEVWGDGLPVDPVRIARSLGIKVLTARLDPDVSGALVKELQQDPVILLNAGDSSNRQRFTCAHEIGHFVKRSDTPEEYEYIDRRDALSAMGRDSDEIYANQFAASLLMPAEAVRRLTHAGLSDLQLALRFDVSLEAMQYRLRNLGLR